MRLRRALIAAIWLAVPYQGSGEEIDELSGFIGSRLCVDPEYLGCLGVSEAECKSALGQSHRDCFVSDGASEGDIYPEPVCITDRFLELLQVSGDKARECDRLLEPNLEVLRNEIISELPNKAKQAGER